MEANKNLVKDEKKLLEEGCSDSAKYLKPDEVKEAWNQTLNLMLVCKAWKNGIIEKGVVHLLKPLLKDIHALILNDDYISAHLIYNFNIVHFILNPNAEETLAFQRTKFTKLINSEREEFLIDEEQNTAKIQNMFDR
jgi:hypothetical protein